MQCTQGPCGAAAAAAMLQSLSAMANDVLAGGHTPGGCSTYTCRAMGSIAPPPAACAAASCICACGSSGRCSRVVAHHTGTPGALAQVPVGRDGFNGSLVGLGRPLWVSADGAGPQCEHAVAALRLGTRA